MNTSQEHDEPYNTEGGIPAPPTPSSQARTENSAPSRRMGFGQRAVVAVLLTVVVIPPAAGFYSYFSGVPLHLLASTAATKEEEEASTTTAHEHVALVSGKLHTLEVPDEVCATLGIRKGERYAVAVAHVPTTTRPLVLPGSTALDPTRLARIRARFAPARVVSLAQVWDRSTKNGHTEYRDIRQGDLVSKSDLLGTFYSVDVGTKKNDLLDALVQLDLDQKILDRVEANLNSVPEVYHLTQQRAVQGDRNAINRALNNLKLWDIPQEEIDALHAEARKICADKGSWYKTSEGRWVKGENQAAVDKSGKAREKEDPWGKVTLRAPFDGVVVERNVHVDEMVVDNTVNLFQIADVSRLLVIANCPEDALPVLEGLGNSQRKWMVHTVGAANGGGLPGTIDEIGYLIDPNQHTAIIKGYVDNPGKRIRAGQFVTATINVPPPGDVVEIPADALVDDGMQSLVFVQSDAGAPRFTMRRVQVTQRFEHTVFVQSAPIPKGEQPTTEEAESGLLVKEPLRPGERVLLAGAVELKAAMVDLESRHEKKPKTGKG